MLYYIQRYQFFKKKEYKCMQKKYENKYMQINSNGIRWHRSDYNMITIQTRKQTNNRKRLCNKQTRICIALTQDNEKSLITFLAESAKSLKIVKCLPNVLFKINIRNLCLRSCFCNLFKKRSERGTKDVVLPNLKILEPRDA